MKRLIFILVFFLCADSAFAQQTKITGQVIAPNGHFWANGTAHASLVCPGNAQAYIGTTPIARDTPTVGLDGNGVINQTLYDYSSMVDVNGVAISCNYVYRITEQCQIANFSTNPLTGITGAGPVVLTSQINATSVNLSPQCDLGTGGIAVQHNGTLVGSQPIVNIIDTGTVVATVTNNTGATRIDVSNAASGAVSGCTLPGINLGVLSEHPAGTCYDSLHFTWDDGTNKQNLQAGDGTNVVGSQLTFAFGSGHTLTGSSKAMTMGTSNTLVCQFCNFSGDSNSVTAVGVGAAGNTQIYGQGQNNTLQGNSIASDYHVYGFNNQIKMGTNVGNSILSVFALTEALTLDAASAFPSNAATINVVSALGKNNNATLSNNNASLFSWTVAGSSNTVEDCIGGCTALGQYGETNDSNAYFVNRVMQYGYNNKLVGNTDQGHFQFAQLVGTSNQFISSGNTGVQNALIAGFTGHLTNCHDCFLFGENGNLSGTNGVVGVGVSATPELQITAGQAALTGTFALNGPTVTKIIAFTFCASGCTLTGTPCTTGSASYSNCTDTITFSSLGTFADTNYSAQCMGVGPIDPAHGAGTFGRVTLTGIDFGKTTTAVPVMTATQGSVPVAWTEIDCTLVHR